MKFQFALSLTVSSLLSISAALPADAIDFQELLRSYVDRQVNKNTNNTQAVVKTNINNRQAQLEQEIEAGVKTGQITSDEETELRNDLVQIAHHEATYLQDGTLQDPEVVQLLNEMNALSSKIQSYLTNKTTTGTGNLSHDAWFRKYAGKPQGTGNGPLPNAELRRAHIDAMQAELDSKIQTGVKSGYITWDDSREYLNTLNRIKQDEMSYLRDGHIDYSEEQKLLSSLRELRRKVNQDGGYAHDRRGRKERYRGRWHASRQSQKPILHQRIANKLAAGQISRSEAYRLYAKERQINELENKLRSGGYTFQQERVMYRELEQLTKNIEDQLNAN